VATTVTGPEAMGARIDALLTSFDGAPSATPPRERAEELVRTIVGMYGAGIERILAIVHERAGAESETFFTALCDDKFVETLLCLHGLHPVPLDERVQAALDAVRPYLRSHEGGIEIVAIADGVVTLRLEGNCKGCPSSAATVKLAVERAILERVPEIREVRAEQAPPQEKPAYDGCVISLDEFVLGVA
jgi:Fe-S cluster biogenesis protein NfuA